MQEGEEKKRERRKKKGRERNGCRKGRKSPKLSVSELWTIVFDYRQRVNLHIDKRIKTRNQVRAEEGGAPEPEQQGTEQRAGCRLRPRGLESSFFSGHYNILKMENQHGFPLFYQPQS